MIDDPDNPAPDDALDDSIRAAMRIEVDDQRLARHEHFWRVQSQRDRWRRNARRTVAAVAAAIGLVAAGVFVLHRGAEQGEQAHVNPGSAPNLVESAPPKPSLADDVQRKEPSELPGRAPTAYEQLVFTARSASETRPSSNAVAIGEVIQRVAFDPKLDPATVLGSSGIKPANAETLLLRRCPGAPANQQQAILRLLTVCGSQRCVPSLLRLGRNEALRTDAISTLEHIVGIDGLGRAVSNSTDRNVRAALILRLLASDSPTALLSYLSLVQNKATRGEALAVAKSAPSVPIAPLIMLLDYAEEPVRASAAITLGHINGPETTRLLIARVSEQPANSREVWLALMKCRGELAREFLAYATRRPQLLGYYNNARIHWSQLIQ